MTMAFHSTPGLTSWGRVIRRTQHAARPAFAADVVAWNQDDHGPRLAIGLGRSYGDTGLYSDGRVVRCEHLDRILAFDPTTGILRAEAGLSLAELMRVFAPRGWFPPVTPGTRRVTLGGAVANDVHGKNHDRFGTFGRHVLALTLLRSDRGVVEVGPDREPELFAATIGGLGLTGMILDVTMALTPIPSTQLDVETFPMRNLSDFFALNADSLARCEQTVAWIDCTRGGDRLGQGVYTRADWSAEGGLKPHGAGIKRVPVDAPDFAINPLSLALFNRAYRTAQLLKARRGRAHYANFFHPLDAIEDWNRLYGARGFYQYQCVVPPQGAEASLRTLLGLIARSGEGSPLVVLKTFGALTSPGLLSFPRPGYTLALDFKNRGQPTQDLLAALDAVVRETGGALYPAKDGRLPRAMFLLGYPQWDRARAQHDPACGSDFLRRMEDAA